MAPFYWLYCLSRIGEDRFNNLKRPASQEHTKKAENTFGDLPEKQEAAPLPETNKT